MKKFFIVFMLTIFLFPSCKKENGNETNRLFLILLGLQLNSGVAFSGKFSGVSTSLGKNSRALPDGITDVLAISAANHYHRSKVDSNGNFSLPLIKGFNYLIVFIDSSNNVKGTYRLDSLSLNSIPTHYAGNSINGGEIEKTTNASETATVYSPLKNFSLSDFYAQAGSTETEMDSLVSLSEQISLLQNIDTDGNGIIDLEEKLYTKFSWFSGWGSNTSSSPASYSLSNSINKFFDLNVIKTETTSNSIFTFNIDKEKVTDKSVRISYPIPPGCNDTNNGVATKSFTDPAVGWLASANDPLSSIGRWAYSINSAFTLSCNNGIFKPVDGTYSFENSGKTYTYRNVKTFSIQTGKTYILPTVKFNTEGSTIKSIEYSFKKVTKTEVTDATSREVTLIYGNTTYASGSGIICRDTTDAWIFSCGIPKENSSGTITSCPAGNMAKLSSPVGVDISTIKNCNFYIFDSYGTYLGVGLDN